MNYLEITVWMEEHQYHALADRLEDDSTMEKVVDRSCRSCMKNVSRLRRGSVSRKSLSRRRLGGSQKKLPTAALFSLRQRRMG